MQLKEDYNIKKEKKNNNKKERRKERELLKLLEKEMIDPEDIDLG
jgi:hypothetical protein